MTERRHPLELDVQAYVDGGDAPDGMIAHLTSCADCRRLADRMQGTEPAEPPDPQALATIIAAAADQAAPAAFVAIMAAEPPDPVPGQVWQLFWDANLLIAVLAEVAANTVTVWPSTLDVYLADQTSLIIDARHTSLAAELACWPGFETVVGSFALHTCLAPVVDVDIDAVAGAWRTGGPLPEGWTRGPERDVTDPCWRESAELADCAAVLSAASWRDAQWDQPDEEAPESLGALLTRRGLSAAWLAETLGVPDRTAIALCRGSRALSAEQNALLTDALGGTAPPLQRPDPAVLDALDRPALRGMLREVSAAEGTDEVAVRRSLASFRAAARQIEDRNDRDVVAQLRIELARRLDTARTGQPTP